MKASESRTIAVEGGLHEVELADWCALIGAFTAFLEDGHFLNVAAIDALRQDLGLTSEQVDLCWDLAKRHPDVADLAAGCIRAREHAQRTEAALVEFANATRAGAKVLREGVS